MDGSLMRRLHQHLCGFSTAWTFEGLSMVTERVPGERFVEAADRNVDTSCVGEGMGRRNGGSENGPRHPASASDTIGRFRVQVSCSDRRRN